MIRYGPHHVNALLCRILDHLPVMSLTNRIGGDQPRPFYSTRSDLLSGTVPPVHHVVGVIGHLRIRLAKGVHVPVPERLTLAPPPHVRRIPHDVIGLGPISRPRVRVFQVLKSAPGIGNEFSRYRTPDPGRRVGPGPRRILSNLVPGQDGVSAFKGPHVFQNRLRRLRVAVRLAPPLMETDPKSEFGYLACPRLDLDPKELRRVHFLDLELRLFRNRLDLANHFELNALKGREGHVEEVATPASWIENADSSKLLVELPKTSERRSQIRLPPLLAQLNDFCLDDGPSLSNWLFDGHAN